MGLWSALGTFFINLFIEEPEHEHYPVNIVTQLQKKEKDYEKNPIGLPMEWIVDSKLENKVIKIEK